MNFFKQMHLLFFCILLLSVKAQSQNSSEISIDSIGNYLEKNVFDKVVLCEHGIFAITFNLNEEKLIYNIHFSPSINQVLKDSILSAFDKLNDKLSRVTLESKKAFLTKNATYLLPFFFSDLTTCTPKDLPQKENYKKDSLTDGHIDTTGASENEKLAYQIRKERQRVTPKYKTKEGSIPPGISYGLQRSFDSIIELFFLDNGRNLTGNVIILPYIRHVVIAR